MGKGWARREKCDFVHIGLAKKGKGKERGLNLFTKNSCRTLQARIDSFINPYSFLLNRVWPGILHVGLKVW